LDNIDEVFMHLTNYAVNKHSSDFVRNDDIKGDDKGEIEFFFTFYKCMYACVPLFAPPPGSKRSLSSVTRLLRKNGHDVDALWDNIVSVIVRSCVAIYPSLLNGYALFVAGKGMGGSRMRVWGCIFVYVCELYVCVCVVSFLFFLSFGLFVCVI
jgi:tubulin polyglutamylase TTLL6/13